MILDMQSLFSDDQAITATAVSTNLIDLGATGTPPLSSTALVRDIGKGTPIEILIICTVAHGGTTPTLVVTIEQDDNVGFSSATVVGTSAEMADAVVGDRASIYFVPEGVNERFIRLNYTAGGTTPTITITAGIALGTQSNKQ